MRHDVRRDIREALGLERNDESRDDYINGLSPNEQFNLYCQWHGLMGWGDRLLEVMRNLTER